MYAVPEERYMKVDEERHRAARELEVGHDSSCVNAFDSLDRLQFNDYSVVHEQVQTISAIHMDAMVDERHRSLPLDREPALHEVPDEAALVTGFQQPGSQLTVNLDSCTDDGSGQDTRISLRGLG